jgi:hypothetical protein
MQTHKIQKRSKKGLTRWSIPFGDKIFWWTQYNHHPVTENNGISRKHGCNRSTFMLIKFQKLQKMQVKTTKKEYQQ